MENLLLLHILTVLLIPIVTYIGYLKLMAAYHTTLNFLVKQGAVIQAAYRLATIALNDALAGDYKAITRLILQMKSANVLTRVTASTTLLFKAAIELLTLRFGAAAKAMRTSWAVLRLNPIAAVTTLIVAAAGALYLYSNRMSEASRRKREMNKINSDAEKSISEEKNKLEALRKVLEDSKQSYGKRKAALDEIQTIVPEYHASLTEEGRLINNNTQALDGYVEKLLLTAKQQAANTKLQEALSQRSDWIRENGTDAIKFKSLEWEIQDPINMGKSLEELAVANGISPTAYRAWSAKKKQLDEDVKYYEQMMQDYTNQLMAIDAKYKVTDKSNPVEEEPDPDSNGDIESEKERKERIQKELEKVETESLKEQKKLKEQYLANDKMTQEEYLQFLSDLEMKYLNKKLEIAGLEPKKREEIMNQILALQLKLKEQCIKEDLDEKKQFLSNQQKALNAELAEESQRYRLGISSREEYLRTILKLLKKYKKDILKTTEDATGEEKEAVDSYIDYVMKALQKAFDQTEEKNKTWQEKVRENWNEINKWSEVSTEQQSAVLVSLLTDIFNFRDESLNAFETVEQKYEATFMLMSGIAQEFGVALGKTLAGEEEAMDEFMQNLVTMVLDTIQKMLIAYIAWTTIRNIGEGGVFIGLAKAAAEIALITAAFETAKSALGNFYTGGYTGPGNWDQPQGIVHSNEFVANRFAVANPNLRPIFDVIDVAQRTGNVGNLTAEDIAAVAGSGKNTHTVPAKAPGASATTTTNDPAMVAMLIECTHALRKLKSRLDDPLVVETYVTGKRGINQAQREYKKLENNKSRNKQ